MTIQAVAWVLEESTATGGERLVLIALANHYSKDGFCYPSYDTIAHEARLSRSAAIRAIQRLEQDGHVHVTRDDKGGRSKVNHYEILGYAEGSRIATLNDWKGSRLAPETVAFGARKGSADATRTKREPNTNRAVASLQEESPVERAERARAKERQKNDEREWRPSDEELEAGRNAARKTLDEMKQRMR